MNDHLKPVWAFLLSDDKDYPETNSDRLVRFSIWPPERKDALLASETCRRVMEGCPEWMMKVARRIQQRTDNHATADNDRTFAVRFDYGSGFETVLLVDGAEAPSANQIKTVHIGLSMVTVSSEESFVSNTDRPQTDAVVSFGSSSKHRTHSYSFIGCVTTKRNKSHPPTHPLTFARMQ